MDADALIVRDLIDLVLLLVALAVLAYAMMRGKTTRSLYPLNGQVLLAIGAGIFLFTFVASSLLPELMSVLQAGPGSSAPVQVVPEAVAWLLTRVSILLFIAGLFIGSWHRKKLEVNLSDSIDQFRSAQDSIEQSESRFRTLFETTSNSIFCYVFDPPMPIDLPIDEQIRRSHKAILTECNTVFARMLEAESPEQIIGSRMGMLDGNKDTEAHAGFFGAFIENDYRLTDYELIYTSANGEERAIRSSLTGIVKNGRLLRFWGAETNILDIRKTRAALAGRRRYQAKLADISSRLVVAAVEDADIVVRECMVELCHFTGADRTALIWYDAANGQIELMHSYDAFGNVYAAPLAINTFPSCAKRLQQNRVVRVNDSDSLPPELEGDADVIRERGLKSFIALPLTVDGDMVGVSTYVHTERKRNWTEQEVLDLRVFSELLASFVLRVRSHRALDEALKRLQQASDRLEAENVYLQQELKGEYLFAEIIGQSDAIGSCLRLVEQVASTMAPVLLLGETGTGKELIARAIHDNSERRDRPLVKVNCAALPANLIESELFGYEKGAFTGADKAKRGRFDLADGSTLFLDEIGEMPLELQPKLLRALQEGEIERLGGTQTTKVDVRIVAATNRDLWGAVERGEFRADLYYRISTFPIELPALRDRGDDVQLLAEHFLRLHAVDIGREIKGISAGMLRDLKDYDWPGNIRELDSVIQRAIITAPGPVLELAEPLAARDKITFDEEPRILSTTISRLKLVERDQILAALDETGWKISGDSGAASLLGIPPSTLRSKMKKLSISRPR